MIIKNKGRGGVTHMNREIKRMNLIHVIISVVFITVIFAGSVFLRLHDIEKVGYL